MRKLEKGDNSAKYRISRKVSGHLHLRHNVCVKYHDPNSSGSPDTLLTRFFMG